MAKQTFTTGSVLTAQQMNDLQTNDFNQTVNQKTASYVLVASDKGTRIEMNSGSATTVTVNTGLFAAGDTLFIQNIGAGVCTVTAGTATVNKSTNASLALSQYQGGLLYFVSASSSIFYPFDAGASASGFVGCSVFGTVSQTISNSTFTALNWNSENIDTNAFHSTSVNTSRITIPTGYAGKYLLNAMVEWGASSTGRRITEFRKNGSGGTLNYVQPQPTSTSGLTVTWSGIADLIVGDYVEVWVWQTSGGNLDVNMSSIANSNFQVVYLGA